MATEMNRNRSNNGREVGKESQLAYTEEYNDGKIMKAVEMAMNNFGFCANRIGAVTRSLTGGIEDLPDLFPTDDSKLEQMFAHERDQRNYKNDERGGHDRCTFDFCEQSQINFTSVPQRHESPSCEKFPCNPLKDMFPRRILHDTVENGGLTAWQLNGRCIIEPNQKFMAISHVWSDGTGTGAWDELKVNRCLYHFFRKIAREFGCEGIWWDTICVPSPKAIRAKALTNMHRNYEKAEITLVHDCFLRNLEWVEAETACLAIVMSPWFSRGWTALELAKSKGGVKVVFKGPGGPVIKDLDRDIIAISKDPSPRHIIASKAIASLRNGSITTVDNLLTVLGSRHTSWARDMAIISGLLVGVEMKDTASQQEIYQMTLREIGKVCHGHLFHNLPTISKGFSWCPISLLDMPLASSEATLSIGENGEAIGTWKVFPLKSIEEEKYIWKDTHPLIAAKLRSSLKQKDDHMFLAESEAESISRALLVKIIKEDSTETCYQFVGSMYFHPGQKLDEIKDVKEERVTIVNEVKAGTKVQKGTDKHESNHPDVLEAEEGVGQMVQCQTNFQPHDLNRRMETQALVDNGKTEAACASEGEGDPNSQNLRLMSEAKNGKVELGQPIGGGANVDFQDEYGRTPLSLAAKEGHEARVKLLLETGKVNIGLKDKDGRTPMSWAAEGGHEAVVKLLLEQYEIRYDSKDNGDQMPQSQAAEGGREAVVELLVKRFISQYDSEDNNGRTPLSRAAEGGHEAVVKLLLKWYEVDVDRKDKDGWTPVSRAALRGHEAVVELLLKTGNAEVDAKDKDGRTPLSRAAENGHEAVVGLLIEKGADMESESGSGQTPLLLAAEYGHEAVVKLLMKKGADVDSRDKLGRTALWWAVAHGHEAVVQLVLKKGVNVEWKDVHYGQTPLSLAAENGHEALVQLLLNNGADMDSKDKHGQSSLWWATRVRHEAVVRLLVEKGADVNSKSENGMTPLLWAAVNGHKALVQLLLEKGADVEPKDARQGRTPLSYAAERGYEGVMKLLIEKGANVESKSGSGSTPLSYAAEDGHEAAVRLLVEKGADVESKSIYGRTPLSYAAENGHEAVVQLLKKGRGKEGGAEAGPGYISSLYKRFFTVESDI
jgi:ankyrin repeat protein